MEKAWGLEGLHSPLQGPRSALSPCLPTPMGSKRRPGILTASQHLCSGRNLPQPHSAHVLSPVLALTPPLLALDHALGRWQATQPALRGHSGG